MKDSCAPLPSSLKVPDENQERSDKDRKRHQRPDPKSHRMVGKLNEIHPKHRRSERQRHVDGHQNRESKHLPALVNPPLGFCNTRVVHHNRRLPFAPLLQRNSTVQRILAVLVQPNRRQVRLRQQTRRSALVPHHLSRPRPGQVMPRADEQQGLRNALDTFVEDAAEVQQLGLEIDRGAGIGEGEIACAIVEFAGDAVEELRFGTDEEIEHLGQGVKGITVHEVGVQRGAVEGGQEGETLSHFVSDGGSVFPQSVIFHGGVRLVLIDWMEVGADRSVS